MKRVIRVSVIAPLLVRFVAAVFVLTFASAAASAQGLPVKTCSNGKTAYLCKGDIVIADGNADAGKSRLVLVDPASGNQTQIAHGDPYLIQAVGVIFDPNDGNLLVADRYNGVIRVNPGTGVQTQLSSGLNDAFGITLDNLGNIFIADSGYRATDPNHPEINVPGRIVQVDRITGHQVVWAQGGNIVHPYGIGFDPIANLLYTTDMSSFSGQGAIFSLDPTNVNSPPRLIWGPGSAVPAPVVPQSTPMGCPLGITVEPTGNILASAFSYPGPPPNNTYGCVPPGIFRVDLINLVQTTVSANPPVGWRLPFGLDVEPNANHTILVNDEGWSAIYRLDPVTGNFVGTPPLSSGNLLLSPVGVSVRKVDPSANVGSAGPPTAAINGAPASSPEGTAIALTSTVTGSDPLTYAWTVTKNGAAYVTGSATSLTFTPDDNGTYAVTLTVTNINGSATDTKTIAVTNVPPSITSVSGPSAVTLGSSVTLTAAFTDPGIRDTHTCTIKWNGVTDSGTVTETNGSGSCTGTHTYTVPATYNVVFTVTDKDGGIGTGTFTLAVNIVTLTAGDILVADANAGGGGGAVIYVNPSTGAQTMVSSGNHFQQAVGIAMESAGTAIVADRINGIIRVNPGTGAQTVLSSGGVFNDPFGVAIDATGAIFVADSGFDVSRNMNLPGKIVRVDPVTGNQSIVSQGGNIIHPYGISVDANGKLVITDMSSFNGNGSILRIDPVTGAQTVLWGPASANPVVVTTSPMACPMGITLEATGTILATAFRFPDPGSYYGCARPGIYRIDLVNRTQTVVSSSPQVGWRFPFGMATEATGNFLVADLGWGSIYRLSPAGQFVGSIPLAHNGYFVAPITLAVVKSH